jgi:hypothetical protein
MISLAVGHIGWIGIRTCVIWSGVIIFARRQRALLSGYQAVARVEELHLTSLPISLPRPQWIPWRLAMLTSWPAGGSRHPLSCQALSPRTNHFKNAGSPNDKARAAEYESGVYKGLADQIQKGLAASMPPDADVAAVADAIVKVVNTPSGKRPFRIHIDPAQDGCEVVNVVADQIRAPTSAALLRCWDKRLDSSHQVDASLLSRVVSSPWHSRPMTHISLPRQALRGWSAYLPMSCGVAISLYDRYQQ